MTRLDRMDLVAVAGCMAALLLGAAAAPAETSRGLAAADSAEADAVLAAAGARQGLCLVLGAGQPGAPELAALMAQKTSLLVHGLALDDAALTRARAAIEARSMAGRAMIEKLTGKSLPYLPQLANLIVVEKPADLAAAGIGKDEMLRVLAPSGTLVTKEAGKWINFVKPRPKEMDEWTHPHHGPDGNLVSADRALTFPISLRWIDGVPVHRGGFGDCASVRAVVLAGGRCFSVSVDNPGPADIASRSAHLLARDAYSGFPLWKINCERTYGKVELDWRNVWPLAATDRRVYTAQGNGLIIADAATGHIETACPTKYQPWRLILLDGSLIAACWEKKELSNFKDGFESDSIRSVWWPAGAGTVEAFDAETGKPKWSLPLTALTIVASDGVVYILTHKGNPPTERELVAVDLASGTEKWRVPHTAFGEEADLCLNFAGPGCAVISKTKARGKRGVFVLSAADGKVRFALPNTTARSIVGGELWTSDGRYDLTTGAKVPGAGVGGTYAGGNVVGGCVPPIVVGGRYITGSRGGAYLQLAENPLRPPVKLSYSGARGACLQGMVPANGMFYTAQNNCGCFGAQVGGFLAIGPCGETPKAGDFEAPRPVEKGPAFGAIEAIPSTDDWPTYRHDAERGAGTSADVPDTLQVLWKVACVSPGDGPFAEAWTARIGMPQPLTAPIVAAGMVIVAGFNAGQVMALNPATGAALWKTALGSRIDSPPTYYKGLLLVGCHDGWAYALRATDGALAYRLRVAPVERRMVAYGMVESVWPATGAVLVHDGTAYVTAGRSTETDGGIAFVAFKPETGETVWARNLGEKTTALIDILSIRDGELAWHFMRFDPKTGATLPPAQRFYSNGSIIDGAWTAGFGKRSGGGLMLGRVCNSMMAWNDRLLVAPGYAVARAKVEKPKPPATAPAKHPDPFKPDELVWRAQLEPHIEWARVYAMALSGNTAFYAGSVFNGWAAGRYDGSFLWMNSAADGKKKQATLKLDAPPAYDGLAIAGRRVYLALQDGTLICLGDEKGVR